MAGEGEGTVWMGRWVSEEMGGGGRWLVFVVDGGRGAVVLLAGCG